MSAAETGCPDCYRARARALRYAAKVAAILSERAEKAALEAAKKAEEKARRIEEGRRE